MVRRVQIEPEAVPTPRSPTVEVRDLQHNGHQSPTLCHLDVVTTGACALTAAGSANLER